MAITVENGSKQRLANRIRPVEIKLHAMAQQHTTDGVREAFKNLTIKSVSMLIPP